MMMMMMVDVAVTVMMMRARLFNFCLLYTSDAADD